MPSGNRGESVIRWIGALCLMATSLAVQADGSEEPVTISAGKIPYVFDSDHPGAYNRILDLMARDLDRPLSIQFFPLTQAMQNMKQPEFDCFAMALKHSPNWMRFGMDPNDYTFVGPIAWLEVKAFVRTEDADVDPDTLHTRRLVADSTIVNLRPTFDERWGNAEITGVESYMGALEALVSGQSDVAITYDVDVQALSDDHPLAGKFVDTGVIVSEQQDGMMCKSSIDLLPVILELQAGLDRISEDGTLNRLLAQPE